MTRRRALLTGMSLLLLHPGTGSAARPDALLQANALPLERVAAYCSAFMDFRREAASAPGRSPLVAAEAAASRATGEVRLAEGASFLRDDDDLAWIARFYAAQLAQGAPFDHRDAGGRHAADRIALLHRRLVGVNGENLYASSAFDPDRSEAAGRLAVDNLMQSPGHRSNMLDPRWTHAGFGAAAGPEGFILVQLFAERAALLRADMPVTLAAGAVLPADCQRAADGTFSGLALVAMDRQVAGSDFMPPGSALAPKTRGLHRSYFARAKEATARAATFTIHPGPIVMLD